MSLIGNGSAGLSEMLRISREECGELRAQLDAAEERAAKAESSREFMKEWYAVRIRRITDTAKRTGIWDEVACILANGTADPHEPPSYDQLLNLKEWRAKAAEDAHRDLPSACKQWRPEAEATEQAGPHELPENQALYAAIDKAEQNKGDR